VVPEPVEKWQAVRGAPGAPGPAHNMLDAFYKEPQRYAYTFQNYVFLTRVMQARPAPGGFRVFALQCRSRPGAPTYAPPVKLDESVGALMFRSGVARLAHGPSFPLEKDLAQCRGG
jgi:hypothetical protein